MRRITLKKPVIKVLYSLGTRVKPLRVASVAAGILAALAVGAQDGPIYVTVDGKPVVFTGPPPHRMLGRVMVPVRSVFEMIGAHVRWDNVDQTVTADRKDISIELVIGSSTATVSGAAVPMDVPAQIYEGSTFVPLRFVCEALGATVNWDRESNTIAILSGYQKNVPNGG